MTALWRRMTRRKYWIVDPAQETVTVLSLTGDIYTERGLFARGDTVTSDQFAALSLPVTEILDAN